MIELSWTHHIFTQWRPILITRHLIKLVTALLVLAMLWSASLACADADDWGNRPYYQPQVTYVSPSITVLVPAYHYYQQAYYPQHPWREWHDDGWREHRWHEDHGWHHED